LGPDQYFVLGDNSPNSHDSRFWPDGGVVPAKNVLGKPFVVHMPGRLLGAGGAGGGTTQETDWSRVRWLP
jgi:signal peptidase I